MAAERRGASYRRGWGDDAPSLGPRNEVDGFALNLVARFPPCAQLEQAGLARGLPPYPGLRPALPSFLSSVRGLWGVVASVSGYAEGC